MEVNDSLTIRTEAVTRWHLDNDLLLNQSKSVVIITVGTRLNLSTPPMFMYCWLNCAICQQYQTLGVRVDFHQSFDQHFKDVIRSCNYHIRSLRHIRPLLDRETAINLACSSVASKLDNCSSVLYCVRETNMAKHCSECKIILPCCLKIAVQHSCHRTAA